MSMASIHLDKEINHSTEVNTPKESDSYGWCDICNKQFKGALGLAIHKSRNSSCRGENYKEGSGKCHECGRQFKNNIGLIRHRISSNCGNDKELSRDSNNSQKPVHQEKNRKEQSDKEIGTKQILSNCLLTYEDVNNEKYVYWSNLEDLPRLTDSLPEDEPTFRAMINKKTPLDEDWRTRANNLSERIASAFNRGLYFDVRLVLLCENRPVEVLGSHQLILSLASTRFQKIFSENTKGKRDILINIVSEKGIENMLRYLYRNEISITTLDQPADTLYIAKIFSIVELEQQCLDYLIKHTNKNNASVILEYSQLLEVKELQEKCQEMLNENTSNYDFSNCSLETVIETVRKILKEGTCSKDILAQSLVDWSREKCRYEEVYEMEENICSFLEPILDDAGCEDISSLTASIIHQQFYCRN